MKKISKPIIIIAVVALLGLIVMLLWNFVVPSVIGCSTLSYPQAICLLLLCKILFGGLGGVRNRAHTAFRIDRSEIRKKVERMSREEKREYIKKLYDEQ